MLSFMLVSCKPASQKISVISSIDYSYFDGTTVNEQYRYNNDGNLSEILRTYSYPDSDVFEEKVVFEYNDSGFPEKSFIYRDDVPLSWYDYKCNSAGKIIEARKYDFDSFHCYIEFIYNSDGTLSKANIYNSFSELFHTVKYSYNNAGNIICENVIRYGRYDIWDSQDFSYSYSPYGDSMLMSFSIIYYSDKYGTTESVDEYALEYDSSGNLCNLTVTPTFEADGFTCEYQHTTIKVTDKTTLFLSDNSQYCGPFFGVNNIVNYANAWF